MVKNIIPVADFLRGTRVYPETILDLIREPILQGAGIQFGSPKDAFSAEFSIEKFHSLAGFDGKDNIKKWAQNYFCLPEAAICYFRDHLLRKEDALLFCMEMPVWLKRFCKDENIPFLDFYINPLRFGQDIYFGLYCSDPLLNQRLAEFSTGLKEWRLEASLLTAEMRCHRRMQMETGSRYLFDLSNTLIFTGQSIFDASLLCERKKGFLRLEDYASEIKDKIKGRRLLHKPHPLSADLAEHERDVLQDIAGAPVEVCKQSAYQILTAEEDVELIGISSGLLQEAFCFDKKSHILYRPFVPLAGMDDKQGMFACHSIYYQTVCSPAFWHQVLNPAGSPPEIPSLPVLAHSYGRRALQMWYDYEKVLTWEQPLPQAAFERSGGTVLRWRIERLEDALMPDVSCETDEKYSGWNTYKNLAYISRVAEYKIEDGGITVKFKNKMCYFYNTESTGTEKIKEMQCLAIFGRGLNTFIQQEVGGNYVRKWRDAEHLNATYYQKLHEKNALYQGNNWLLPEIEHLKLAGGSSILEVACGNGRFLEQAAGHWPLVAGMDWARSPRIDDILLTHKNVTFYQKDLVNDLIEGTFDLVASADFLEHIAEQDLPVVMQKLLQAGRFNYHKIACYDDGDSHLSIFEPEKWLRLWQSCAGGEEMRIVRESERRNNPANKIVVIANF